MSQARAILGTVKVIQNSNEACLTRSVKPEKYWLSFIPNFDDFTFTGQVVIKYHCTDVNAQLNDIVLHSLELEIIGGHNSTDDKRLRHFLKKIRYNYETETVGLEFEEKLHRDGLLHLNFKGILNDKLKGFYRSKVQIGEHTIYAAATQLCATGARRCFPCWDEPSFKATFSLVVSYPKTVRVGDQYIEMVCLSNMETEFEDSGSTTFHETPVMSTYLLAFVIGPFKHVGSSTVKVWTTPGKERQGEFALGVAIKSLDFYSNYFGVGYPLNKMDMIAIPDCLYGAMENWGLIVYRETSLLADFENTAVSERQAIALTVAHEIAHQWFGNLVTMEWWTHLWLNEGFATFMQFLCVDRLYPDLQVFEHFTSRYLGRALALDSLRNSHPIEVPVKNTNEIDEIFDAISYNKGASILRMLYTFIGDECFRNGIKHYLEKFAYKNATTEDLWDALGAASNKPVRELMSGWTSQVNYPWISVTYREDDLKLELTQSRFTADGKLDKSDAARWMIPISFITSNDPEKPQELCTFSDRTNELTLDLELNSSKKTISWLKLNPGTIGLYRTAYPNEIATGLRAAIVDKTLPPMDRLGLQDDSYALCKAGMIETAELLELLKAYKGETVYSVWSSIDATISGLSLLLSSNEVISHYQRFSMDLYAEIYAKLGWAPSAGETQNDAMTRALVINRLVSLGHKEIIVEAKRKYDAHVGGSEIILPDIRSSVYRAIATHGSDEDFDKLFCIYRASDSQEEKNRAAMALGFAQDKTRLNRAIKFAMSDEVRNQDRPHFFMTLGAGHPAVAFQTLKDHKDFILSNFESGPLISKLVDFSTRNLIGDQYEDGVKDFFAVNNFPGCERTIQQSLETIRLNTNWLKRDIEHIVDYLSVRA